MHHSADRVESLLDQVCELGVVRVEVEFVTQDDDERLGEVVASEQLRVRQSALVRRALDVSYA